MNSSILNTVTLRKYRIGLKRRQQVDLSGLMKKADRKVGWLVTGSQVATGPDKYSGNKSTTQETHSYKDEASTGGIELVLLGWLGEMGSRWVK